jgi:hypothetical protein
LDSSMVVKKTVKIKFLKAVLAFMHPTSD